MPSSGDLIGPYRLVSQLGAGAMGEVWRARDERLDRYVALKLLPAELAADPERRARMLREARAAAAIRHHNVVTLFDIVENENDAGGDSLVMELVEGRTLSDVLRKDGKPAIDTALRWLEGIADALVAAHARRILHRDIKAANIMITPDGGVKVLDFGLAKVRDETAAASMSLRIAAPKQDVALDATMPSSPGKDIALDATQSSNADDSYQTHAGSLLGTPIYMAPEQISGSLPDERSEVFSVGVLAYELLTGKPPYTATSMDALFQQIVDRKPPPLDGVSDSVSDIVMRALAKEPAARWPSMQAFRDAIAHVRKPRRSKWPLVAVAAVVLAAGGGYALTHRAHVERPGDVYVNRALEEYDVFYNDKALSSLRAALRVNPDHPRANAYMILFGGAPPEDRDAAIAAAKRARPRTGEHSKDRALLDAAITYTERGAAEAKAALLAAGAAESRELAFWAAELDWRSGQFAAARDGYQALLASPAKQLRGRIYDHYSSVLIYFDDPTEALRIGTLYRDTFPGEADAVGTYATTLAMAGRLDEAEAAARDALRLNEGEDTLAGLAKVLALKGDHAGAKQYYAQSLDRAGASRRPVRRAALGFLQWIDGELDAAKATVAPCLTGTERERGACLFVAGVIDPSHAEEIATQLDQLAAEGVPTKPAYGFPGSLATLVRARAKFFGGGCVTSAAVTGDIDPATYHVPLDFYATYHVPFFATWATCEEAAALAAHGNKAAAVKLLEPVAHKAPNRKWLVDTLARYE